MKADVDFLSQQIKYCPWRIQTFDTELTNTECSTCQETDNVSGILYLTEAYYSLDVMK